MERSVMRCILCEVGWYLKDMVEWYMPFDGLLELLVTVH